MYIYLSIRAWGVLARMLLNPDPSTLNLLNPDPSLDPRMGRVEQDLNCARSQVTRWSTWISPSRSLSLSHTPSRSHTLTFARSLCEQGGGSKTSSLRSQGPGSGSSVVKMDLPPPGRRKRNACLPPPLSRDFLIENLLVRIHLIIEMILVDRPCAMEV